MLTPTDINMDYLLDFHIHLEHNIVFIYYQTHSHLWHFKHLHAKLLKLSAQTENYYKGVIKRSTTLPIHTFHHKIHIIIK
jgi:predicted deacylase